MIFNVLPYILMAIVTLYDDVSMIVADFVLHDAVR